MIAHHRSRSRICTTIFSTFQMAWSQCANIRPCNNIRCSGIVFLSFFVFTFSVVSNYLHLCNVGSWWHSSQSRGEKSAETSQPVARYNFVAVAGTYQSRTGLLNYTILFLVVILPLTVIRSGIGQSLRSATCRLSGRSTEAARPLPAISHQSGGSAIRARTWSTFQWSFWIARWIKYRRSEVIYPSSP